jgi:gamma-glutamyltranspeptidase / glutathione hydrolase
MALRSQWRANKEEVVAPNGVVTAMLPPSAEAGLAMLKAGGNAVDAAVAMGFCNVVLEPYNAVIGGMGYMLVHLAEEGRTIGVDFNARAPMRAYADMYQVEDVAPAGYVTIYRVAGNANDHGPLAVTVPGTCAGFCEVHRRYGRLPLAQVMEPAISLASDGFEANWHTTLFIANRVPTLNEDPYLAAMWLPNGEVPRSSPRTGERIIQRDLGDLLRRVAAEGPAAMYQGEVAETIHAWMVEHGGLLTRDDLAAYQPTFAEPLRHRFMGRELACVATPSGTLTNFEMFGILDQLDLSAHPYNSAPYLHLLIEAARHSFADRYRWLGDWEHAPVPLRGLLADGYAAELARQIQPGRSAFTGETMEPWGAYSEHALHDPWPFNEGGARPDPIPALAGSESESTTHFNVVDKDRNAVTCTHTGTWGDAHPANTGAYLTHGMAWFNPRPDHTNSIAPWKRPMNNMCPMMAFENGRPVILQGAPGARRIMHRGVQVLLNQLLHGMGPQDAVAALTVDASGRETLVDSRFPDAVVAELRAYGHEVKLVEEEPGMLGNFSRPSAVQIDYDRGVVRAGVDVFRPSVALGY